MLYLGRVAALLFALAACRKPLFPLGLAVCLGIGALLAYEAAPIVLRTSAAGGMGGAFGLVFLGPSTEPMWPPLAQGAAAGAVSLFAFRRASPLRPEDERARAWDRAGLRFLFVAILDGMLVVLGLLLARLTRDP